MEALKLHDGEYKFVSIIWDMEPVKSPDLVKVCEEKLGWKKSTTYTMLRRLADRGILKSENTVVSALITREHVIRYEADAFLDKAFNGSVPAFIAAYIRENRLSQKELQEIQSMIEEAKK